MSSGRLQELKKNGKSLNFQAQKWSWSLTGGGNVLVFWIDGHLHVWEVVAYGRWTDMEVRL